MSDFLQDVWHDLREKRLWPIAAALLIAAVGAPVLMIESADEAVPVAEAPVAVDPDADEVEVTLAADAQGRGSSLDGFGSKDPFRPPASALPKAGGTAISEAAGSGSATGDTGSDGGSSAPGGRGESPPAQAPSKPRTTVQYEYVVDVTFWNGNRRRDIGGMRKLDMLPSQARPVLIFMGVTGNGGNAVFLVDSTLRATGEGRCSPSRANCAFVHIGPGSEQAFTTEAGDAYRLRVDEIRKVEITAASARAGKARRREAAASAHAVRRFALPSLSDLVVVSGGPDNRSGLESDSR